MKLSTELLKAPKRLADGKCYRTLARHHEGTLYAFYRSLNREERRARFGGAVSDDAIARHCDQIDWRSTLVIAFGTAFRLDAVALNCRIDSGRVENATIATMDGRHAVPTLLRLSAVAARDLFAADRMLVCLEDATWMLRHLQELGSIALTEEFAELDVTSIAEQPAIIGDDFLQPVRADAQAAGASSCG